MAKKQELDDHPRSIEYYASIESVLCSEIYYCLTNNPQMNGLKQFITNSRFWDGWVSWEIFLCYKCCHLGIQQVQTISGTWQGWAKCWTQLRCWSRASDRWACLGWEVVKFLNGRSGWTEWAFHETWQETNRLLQLKLRLSSCHFLHILLAE